VHRQSPIDNHRNTESDKGVSRRITFLGGARRQVGPEPEGEDNDEYCCNGKNWNESDPNHKTEREVAVQEVDTIGTVTSRGIAEITTSTALTIA
jgi:hypothetical protein